MSAPGSISRHHLAGPGAVVAGLIVATLAWMLPANFRSVSPALLESAGSKTPTVAQFGRQLVEAEKIGPATEVLKTAKLVNDPETADLSRRLDQLTARQPEFAAWGGWDPFLDPLFNLRNANGHTGSTPVMTFLIPGQTRQQLRDYLGKSGSIGVQTILRTRTLPFAAGHLTAADKPGGEPTDVLVILTALLYQGEKLSPPLQRQLHQLADTALVQKDLGDLGSFYLDLLSLSRRLDWVQLSELLRRTSNTRTVAEYAQLARAASDVFPQIYTAALFTTSTSSADRVADYLIQYGKTGADNLKLALGEGEGAVRVLIERQAPINHTTGPAIAGLGLIVLAFPELMLGIKYLGYFFAAFLILMGLDRWIVSPDGMAESERAAPQIRSGLIALFLAGLFIVATEPFLLKAAPSVDYLPHLRVLGLTASVTPSPSTVNHSPSMNTSTLVTIGIFALLQVMMYFVCLQKINQIARQDIPALLKLRLTENEENLFDCGLYVGMMGTAAALVLQVLGVISPNLLAAYSSNLFGLLCVAMVKIRHVRQFKKRLILEIETGLRSTPA